MNKVILTGFTGNDPQTHTFASGDKKVTISLATSERWIDKNTGDQREKTEWHTVVFPTRSHDTVLKYLAKGRKILVEGKVTYNNYEKDGKRMMFTEIHCTHFEFLDSKQNNNQNNAQPQNNTQPNNEPALSEPFGFTDHDENVPF